MCILCGNCIPTHVKMIGSLLRYYETFATCIICYDACLSTCIRFTCMLAQVNVMATSPSIVGRRKLVIMIGRISGGFYNVNRSLSMQLCSKKRVTLKGWVMLWIWVQEIGVQNILQLLSIQEAHIGHLHTYKGVWFELHWHMQLGCQH